MELVDQKLLVHVIIAATKPRIIQFQLKDNQIKSLCSTDDCINTL